ncbi:MAG TPA: dihydropteroate synthase [Opitutaceae bacterium]
MRSKPDNPHPPAWGAMRPALPWSGRTGVMGILNATPDSFFDGGRHDAPDAAGIQARRMAEEGADVIDIGAESTRPGFTPVPEAEELRRLLPIIERVRSACSLPISVDTTKAAVARAALAAGAAWINDIWGLQGDVEMVDVVAEGCATVVIMHNQHGTDYPDGLVAGICRFLEKSLRLAEDAGVPLSRVVLDPGIGFGKTPAQNLEVLRALGEFRRFGLPLLLGASRKSVVGHVLKLPVAERLEGSLVTTVAAVAAGFDVVRVHDVQAHVRTARMAEAIYRVSHG